VVATVSTSVSLTLLLDGASALPWIGRGPEDQMPDLPADATVDDALRTDVERADQHLDAMSRRLAARKPRDAHELPAPDALVEVVRERLAAPADDTDPTIDYVALRIGVGLGRLARLADA
jgi:hypothetical protein